MTGLKKFISKRLANLNAPQSSCAPPYSLLHLLDERRSRTLLSLFGRAHIGLVTLEIRDFYTMHSVHDTQQGARLLDMLEYEAQRLIPQFYHYARVLFSTHVGFCCIALFFEITDDFTAFANATHLFRLQMAERVNLALGFPPNKPLTILAGCSHIESWCKDNPEKVLYRAFCQARRLAQQPRECDSLPLHDEFNWILESERIGMVYQAVINFDNGSVIGWEAFMRGPGGSFFHMPERLFTYAEENGEALRLDRLCRLQALQRFGNTHKNKKLFMNIHPACFNDPNFTPQSVAREVEHWGLTPGIVVLEFTERYFAHDLNYYLNILQDFKHEGFHLAIDDVGSGHASLRSLSQLRPDYVKVDISLVGNVDTNPYHRVMVETLAYLAEKIDARLIAVGIETETELSSLVSMDIFGGQGNFLSPPAERKIATDVRLPLRASFSNENIQSLKCSLPIGELANDTIAVSGNTSVKDIKARLADKPPQTSVVVLRGQYPIGLLMQYSMDRHLSTQFGMSLYYHRDVGRIMDAQPLIVDAAMPMEEVARKAMERESTKIYDDIIVTRKEIFCGVVSVQRMLDSLAKTQVELAKGANPLSGLPGNVSIEKEIEGRAGKCTATSLIYVDLDNFKIYNDVFGFERGDRIILLTAKVLAEATQTMGDAADFVGHVGGDDFVILANPETSARICETALKEFEMQTPGLYRKEDVERGYIVGKGRDGKTSKFPLTSLSIAIIDCDFAPPFNMERLSSRVAEVKKVAKSIRGNSCIREKYAASSQP